MKKNLIVTSGKKFEAIRRLLKTKNRRFVKLTKPEKRTAIAQDVLEQLAAKKFRAKSIYFDVPKNLMKSAEAAKVDASVMLAQAPSCTVCGIGSLFVSACQLADKLPVKDLAAADRRNDEVDRNGSFIDANKPIRNHLTGYLGQWFTDDQLDLIEIYFEDGRTIPGTDEYRMPNNNSPIHHATSPTRRMRMIMENIISNGGEFNPWSGANRIPLSVLVS